MGKSKCLSSTAYNNNCNLNVATKKNQSQGRYLGSHKKGVYWIASHLVLCKEIPTGLRYETILCTHPQTENNMKSQPDENSTKVNGIG